MSSPRNRLCEKPARAENAQNCFLSFLLSTVTARAVLFLFNVIETNFLRASPTSEFSHSLDPERTSPCEAIGTAHDHETRFWRPRRRAWYDSSDIEADI